MCGNPEFSFNDFNLLQTCISSNVEMIHLKKFQQGEQMGCYIKIQSVDIKNQSPAGRANGLLFQMWASKWAFTHPNLVAILELLLIFFPLFRSFCKGTRRIDCPNCFILGLCFTRSPCYLARRSQAIYLKIISTYPLYDLPQQNGI